MVATEPAALFFACALFGLSAGNLLTLPALIIQREFETAAFGMLIGLSWAISQFTYAFGPGLLGILRDLTGGYGAPLALCIVLQIAAAAVIRLCHAAAAGAKRREPPSARASRFQIIVGLDDLAQLVLAAAVAAVGVGMVALHQQLEARLDLGAVGALLEAELVQRLALGVAHGALRLDALRVRPPVAAAAKLPEHVERVLRALRARTRRRRAGCPSPSSRSGDGR